MLIRPEQMNRLSQAISNAFENQMFQKVKQSYPEKSGSVPEDQLRSIVRTGINRAKEYGIDRTNDVERFIDLMFRFPRFDFEQDPPSEWALEILTDPASSPQEKLDQVEGRAALGVC
jgi:hypothetical protein